MMKVDDRVAGAKCCFETLKSQVAWKFGGRDKEVKWPHLSQAQARRALVGTKAHATSLQW